MSEQIQASSKQIIELTKGINTCLKRILFLNQDLSVKLKNLGNTFQDEGYEVIKAYVSSSQNKVSEAGPDLELVMSKLIEYVGYLKESEKYTI